MPDLKGVTKGVTALPVRGINPIGRRGVVKLDGPATAFSMRGVAVGCLKVLESCDAEVNVEVGRVGLRGELVYVGAVLDCL